MAEACIESSLVERAREVVRLLKKKNLSVVTAESCTAGLISAVLSQAEGAGDVLHGSFVTYTKANKRMALGVDEDLLKERGSVNAEVVRQLACGALDRSPADMAIAVSGVLGPDTDEDGNPVGLIFFATCRRNGEPKTLRRDFGKKPHDVLRRGTVMQALDLLQASALEDQAGSVSAPTRANSGS
ncbi:MAG TPA: CinA family protein [Parvibaculum sp.]|jgi:nicotinamide-nucleotide amidase